MSADPAIAEFRALIARPAQQALARVRAELQRRCDDCATCAGAGTLPEHYSAYPMTDDPRLRTVRGVPPSVREARALTPKVHPIPVGGGVEHAACQGCLEWRQLIDLTRVEL